MMFFIHLQLVFVRASWLMKSLNNDQDLLQPLNVMMRSRHDLRFSQLGVSSSSWGYPKVAGWFMVGKIPLKWMMTGGPPMTQETSS